MNLNEIGGGRRFVSVCLLILLRPLCTRTNEHRDNNNKKREN